MKRSVSPERAKAYVRAYLSEKGYAYAMSVEEVAAASGLSRIARLASNENPIPPSAQVIEAGLAALRGSHRYPDETTRALVAALRKFHGEYPFVTGVGMDGVIETTLRTLVSPGETVAISTPTFSFYRLAALAQGAEVVHIPRETGFLVDADRFIRESRGAKVAFLCTPNNPTGNATPVPLVEEILSAFEGVLVLDNAYIEFSDLDYLPLLSEYENLIIGRTFSKAFSLAGMRVGYAFVPAWLRPAYAKAATPHTLNAVSAAAAAAALQEKEHLNLSVSRVRAWRERVMRECPLPVTPSDANFLMVDVSPLTGEEAVRRLAKRGVLVRSCASFPGIDDHYIRVSIGEDWEMEAFLSAIRSL